MRRDPLDRYYTPDALADACLAFLRDSRHFTAPEVVYEPCAGGGAFGRAAHRHALHTQVVGCDPDLDAPANAHFHVDPCCVEHWSPTPNPHGFILTNPHYTNIYETIVTMRSLQARTDARILGLLLRATTLEHLMASGDPPYAIGITRQRPRWGGPGGAQLTSSDSRGSVWAVWRREKCRTSTLYPMADWRPRGRHG